MGNQKNKTELVLPGSSIRRIDELGRIAIPSAIREAVFGTENTSGKLVDIYFTPDEIILRPRKRVSVKQKLFIVEFYNEGKLVHSVNIMSNSSKKAGFDVSTYVDNKTNIEYTSYKVKEI